MQKISIGLIGGSGKMGQQLITKIIESTTYHLAAVFARQPLNVSEYVNDIADVFKKSAVVIDFSTADFIDTVLSRGLSYKTPLVIGTTGLTSNHHQRLLNVAKEIPIVYDVNMSIGIALLKKAVHYFSQNLNKSFDRDIVEFHHRHKKDAPSGTSLDLANCLSSTGTSALHCSALTKRCDGDVGISVIRAGGILAEQQVHFTSNSEQIILTHRCLDRGVYAEGALKAADWIIDKTPGLYKMDDVLGIK